MSKIIPFQLELSQAIPKVIGNVDYTEFLNQLERIDGIIKLSKLDDDIIRYFLMQTGKNKKNALLKEGKKYNGLSDKEKWKIRIQGQQILRLIIARHLKGESFRKFSCSLADSPLLQNFCMIDNLGVIKVPTKSTLERYEKMVPDKIIRKIVKKLNLSASKQKEAGEQKIDLEEAINLEDYYADGTCVKVNIHYPVDWVLLRDATRTLTRAVELIRNQGLKNRMSSVAEFMREMNKLCIEMTHASRKKDSKKRRKKVLRLMKKLLKKISHHAKIHRDLLELKWVETDFSEKEAKQIINRIDRILEKLPEAIWQAHERIIGERRVKNKKKILSLYEEEVHVITRGKAGSYVEFGNTLFLGEQEDGIIIDWFLYKDQAPSDNKMLKESLVRLEIEYKGFKPKSVTSDRGCQSKKNEKYLEEKEIKSYLCPRSVKELEERLKEENFVEHQRRRGQTEGRIGIIKNNFLGSPLKSKGFKNRNLRVSFGVLTHNLWVIARLPKTDEESKQIKKAA